MKSDGWHGPMKGTPTVLACVRWTIVNYIFLAITRQVRPNSQWRQFVKQKTTFETNNGSNKVTLENIVLQFHGMITLILHKRKTKKTEHQCLQGTHFPVARSRSTFINSTYHVYALSSYLTLWLRKVTLHSKLLECSLVAVGWLLSMPTSFCSIAFV
jgi:hypothetical protein